MPDSEHVPSSGRKDANWVSKTGGLPDYINRIAKDLMEKGMTESHAIATAVNTVKKWARGGGDVKPDTKAKAAAALAEWERKKAQAHADLSTPARQTRADHASVSGVTTLNLATLQEDQVPSKSKSGARLVDFAHGKATYADGSVLTASGWTKGGNVKKAQATNNANRAKAGLKPVGTKPKKAAPRKALKAKDDPRLNDGKKHSAAYKKAVRTQVKAENQRRRGTSEKAAAKGHESVAVSSLHDGKKHSAAFVKSRDTQIAAEKQRRQKAGDQREVAGGGEAKWAHGWVPLNDAAKAQVAANPEKYKRMRQQQKAQGGKKVNLAEAMRRVESIADPGARNRARFKILDLAVEGSSPSFHMDAVREAWGTQESDRRRVQSQKRQEQVQAGYAVDSETVPAPYEYRHVAEIWNTHLIVKGEGGKVYKVPYSPGADGVNFKFGAEQQVKHQYVELSEPVTDEVLLATVDEAGVLDLAAVRPGQRYRHGWIPINPVAIKAQNSAVASRVGRVAGTRGKKKPSSLASASHANDKAITDLESRMKSSPGGGSNAQSNKLDVLHTQRGLDLGLHTDPEQARYRSVAQWQAKTGAARPQRADEKPAGLSSEAKADKPWNEIHKDYKGVVDGKRMVMDGEGGTHLRPYRDPLEAQQSRTLTPAEAANKAAREAHPEKFKPGEKPAVHKFMNTERLNQIARGDNPEHAAKAKEILAKRGSVQNQAGTTDRPAAEVQKDLDAVAAMQARHAAKGDSGPRIAPGKRVNTEFGPGTVKAATGRSVTITLDDGQEIGMQTGTHGHDRLLEANGPETTAPSAAVKAALPSGKVTRKADGSVVWGDTTIGHVSKDGSKWYPHDPDGKPAGVKGYPTQADAINSLLDYHRESVTGEGPKRPDYSTIIDPPPGQQAAIDASPTAFAAATERQTVKAHAWVVGDQIEVLDQGRILKGTLTKSSSGQYHIKTAEREIWLGGTATKVRGRRVGGPAAPAGPQRGAKVATGKDLPGGATIHKSDRKTYDDQPIHELHHPEHGHIADLHKGETHTQIMGPNGSRIAIGSRVSKGYQYHLTREAINKANLQGVDRIGLHDFTNRPAAQAAEAALRTFEAYMKNADRRKAENERQAAASKTAAAEAIMPKTSPKPGSSNAEFARKVASEIADFQDQLREQHYSVDTFPMDRLRDGLADAVQHGDKYVTVKVPSGSEVTLTIAAARAILLGKGKK